MALDLYAAALAWSSLLREGKSCSLSSIKSPSGRVTNRPQYKQFPSPSCAQTTFPHPRQLLINSWRWAIHSHLTRFKKTSRARGFYFFIVKDYYYSLILAKSIRDQKCLKESHFRLRSIPQKLVIDARRYLLFCSFYYSAKSERGLIDFKQFAVCPHFIIIFESVMNNAQINRKPALPTQHRTLHSQKKLAQIRLNHNRNSHANVGRPQLNAFIQFIPSDEALIEQYIEELKDKLQQIRNSPKKRSARMETQQIFKRKYSEEARSKSKTKSNEGNPRGKSIVESTSFQTAKKSALLDFRQARDEFKRSKQKLVQRRVVTQKENHRYIEDKPERTAVKNTPAVTQSCDLRARSNTEVLRSQKNPARFYRYSSLKKAPCVDDTASVNNNFLFDKIINVHHNINIHLDEHSPKERLRREPNEEVLQQKVKQKSGESSKSPKKAKLSDSSEKIEDLSTINARKETLNFLGESCLALKEQLVQKEDKEMSKILDFLGWKTNEMRKVLTNIKQKKRKNGLDKLGKIFPKGFFS